MAVLDDAAFGAATPVVPARLSSTDPAARYTSAHGGQAQFCYATNYLVDVANAVIIAVEASTAVRQAELTAAKRMIERAHDDLGLWPRKLIADTGMAQRRCFMVGHEPPSTRTSQSSTSLPAVTAPLSGPTSPMTSTRIITPAQLTRC